MALSNMKAAFGLCHSLYGITPDEDSFEDLALTAWNKIGVKHTRLYRYEGSVKNGTMELPCNLEDVDLIESVHIPVPDAQVSSNSANFPWQNIWIESYIDRFPRSSDPYFHPGKLVKYDKGDTELYFSHNYPKVMIVYHGIFADEEDGLPLVNDKELTAIATFVAYASKYKEGIKKNDSNLLKIAQTLEEKWLRACNAARIPDHLSQNDMDAILDAKTSWNRKSYNLSYSPHR